MNTVSAIVSTVSTFRIGFFIVNKIVLFMASFEREFATVSQMTSLIFVILLLLYCFITYNKSNCRIIFIPVYTQTTGIWVKINRLDLYFTRRVTEYLNS